VKRRYSTEFDPPAPMVPVSVRAPGGVDLRALLGKLDSGGDICAVPLSVIEELDLPPVRKVRAAGFAGELVTATVFMMDLVLADMTFSSVEALATRRPYVIVGRSVLRHFVLRLDGPKSELHLSAPRRTSASRSRGQRLP
jgi:predicted aspartyl protease